LAGRADGEHGHHNWLKRKEILLESKSGLDGAGCVITTALQGEAKLHGFRSGGGLRVLRLGDFYGEAPTFEDALALLADDIRAGGRDYADVYGKLVPHYVTGNCAASSPVDLVLLRGCCVDAWREGVDVVATLGGYEELQVPADVCVRVDEGESVTWEAHGRAAPAARAAVDDVEDPRGARGGSEAAAARHAHDRPDEGAAAQGRPAPAGAGRLISDSPR
jgi:hypothetical protein